MTNAAKCDKSCELQTTRIIETFNANGALVRARARPSERPHEPKLAPPAAARRPLPPSVPPTGGGERRRPPRGGGRGFARHRGPAPPPPPARGRRAEGGGRRDPLGRRDADGDGRVGDDARAALGGSPAPPGGGRPAARATSPRGRSPPSGGEEETKSGPRIGRDHPVNLSILITGGKRN